MNIRLTLLLLALLPLAACNRQADSTAPSADAPAATTETAAATDAETAAAAEAAAAASANPNSATAPADTAAPTADATTAAAAPATPTGLVAGTDYIEIKGGQPFEPLNGKIEVVEVFNFVCPACAAFQPLVVGWKQSLPADVRFTYVPAAFGREWDTYVHAFYAAQSMGLAEKTHDPLYNAIHIEKSLDGERGDKDTPEDIAKFYARYGANAKQFVSTMESFSVKGKFNKAKQFMLASGVDSTPTIIVNGKYRVRGKSLEDVLRITDQLIAQERAAQAGAAAQ